MAPKMEVRDKTFTAARRQGDTAARQWSHNSKPTTWEASAEHGTKSEESPESLDGSRSLWDMDMTPWHIDFDLETNKKSNKNGSMYIILHHCTSIWGMLQKYAKMLWPLWDIPPFHVQDAPVGLPPPANPTKILWKRLQVPSTPCNTLKIFEAFSTDSKTQSAKSLTEVQVWQELKTRKSMKIVLQGPVSL